MLGQNLRVSVSCKQGENTGENTYIEMLFYRKVSLNHTLLFTPANSFQLTVVKTLWSSITTAQKCVLPLPPS